MKETKSKGNHCNGPSKAFITGVVEGFYGKPWTTGQRKELFAMVAEFGLNTYMYAPKDDAKHRALWRDLYTVEETDVLTKLIQAATACGVTFVYAISPGLDIIYSSSKEAGLLKRKLSQVASFGCTAFAILFDDIEPQLGEADLTAFNSLAAAQAAVSNDVYEHLGQPQFLFCPTEYCASRALPTVEKSEYLTTIGKKLLPGIDILWTGPKVVSKRISVDSMKELHQVLQRPPVIWDNIHANDYDQRRIYLGPFAGRSTEILPHIRGVLSNPNCEFEPNFIPLHTLGQWFKAHEGSIPQETVPDKVGEGVAEETTADQDTSVPDLPPRDDTTVTRPEGAYHPRKALCAALQAWLVRLHKHVTPTSVPAAVAPFPTDDVKTCMAVTSTTLTPAAGPPITNLNQLTAPDASLQQNQSYQQPAPSATILNSLVPESSSPVGDLATDPSPGTKKEGDDCTTPMECDTLSSAVSAESQASAGTTEGGESMQVEDIPAYSPTRSDSYSAVDVMEEDGSGGPPDLTAIPKVQEATDILSAEDAALLADIFYLPFEYGPRAVEMLEEVHWLKNNAHIVGDSLRGVQTKEVRAEWDRRAHAFHEWVEAIHGLAAKVYSLPNKSLVHSLHPYLWDLRGVLSVVSAYLRWLGTGNMPYVSVCHYQGSLSWCSVGYKSTFISGDHEPWVFQGGLQMEFQRMLPISGSAEWMPLCPPPVITPVIHTVRPFLPQDESVVYEICRRTCDDGLDGTDVFPNFPELIGDKRVGGLLTLSPEYCFVLTKAGHGEAGGASNCPMGYALAALDAKLYYKQHNVAWLPALMAKYPRPESSARLTPAEELISALHDSPAPAVGEEVHSRFPSLVQLAVSPTASCADPGAPKRLLAAAVAALKANGSHGAHATLNVGDRTLADFYSRLSFTELPRSLWACIPEDVVVMARSF